MNDLDLCLEVVSRSCQPLRYIRRWISRKPLEMVMEAWFQRTTNMKWPMGYQDGHVTDDVTWPPKVLWGNTVGYPNDSLGWLLVLKSNDTGFRELHDNLNQLSLISDIWGLF